MWQEIEASTITLISLKKQEIAELQQAGAPELVARKLFELGQLEGMLLTARLGQVLEAEDEADHGKVAHMYRRLGQP